MCQKCGDLFSNDATLKIGRSCPNCDHSISDDVEF